MTSDEDGKSPRKRDIVCHVPNVNHDDLVHQYVDRVIRFWAASRETVSDSGSQKGTAGHEV